MADATKRGDLDVRVTDADTQVTAGVTNYERLKTDCSFGDTASIDSFGRLRVSNPFTLFDAKLIQDKADLFFDEITNGTATSSHNSGDGSVTMSVNANNDYVIRQTYMAFNYQPGKSQLIYLSGVLGAVTANTEARIGYFNTFGASSPYTSNRDGVYFGRDGSDVYVAISKSGTETKYTQSNWNVDTMDGNGTSGIDLDFTKSQIFFIDFEWLGVGRIRFGFVIDGLIYYCHYANNANNITGVYMSSPSHSIRYEIRSTGGSSSLKQICSSVQSEGGRNPSGVIRGIDTGITSQQVGTTLEALIGFRLKSTYLCSTVLVNRISVMALADEDTRWALLLNPTYANTPTWTSAGTSSPVEYAVGDGGNTVSANGEILASGYGSDNINNVSENLDMVIHPGASIDGVRDELWLSVQTIQQSGDYVAGMVLNEFNCG